MAFLTYADTRTLPERNMRVVWSILLVFLCKTFGVKFLRLWEVLRIMMDTQHRDVNADPCRYSHRPSTTMSRKFIVTDAFSVKKRKYGILPECLCENTSHVALTGVAIMRSLAAPPARDAATGSSGEKI
jgi:hypothetical protein